MTIWISDFSMMASSKSKNRVSGSGKFGIKSGGKKKRHQAKDKLDLEDSGVHLDDSYLGITPTVSLHDHDDTDPGVCLRDNSQSNLSTQMTNKTVNLPTPQFGKHCTISAPDLTAQRVSKSESPKPSKGGGTPSEAAQQFPSLAVSSIRSVDTRKHYSVLDSRSSQPPVFSLGPDSDEEADRNKAKKCSTHVRPKDARREKSSNKGRFKKILRPLRRSHSAGSTKDVPAHALFLRHDLTEHKTPPGRSSIDTGRGSMERQSDDSDSDSQETSQSDSKSSTSSSKPKKKKVPTATLR